jgi:hypothetical protein
VLFQQPRTARPQQSIRNASLHLTRHCIPILLSSIAEASKNESLNTTSRHPLITGGWLAECCPAGVLAGTTSTPAKHIILSCLSIYSQLLFLCHENHCLRIEQISSTYYLQTEYSYGVVVTQRPGKNPASTLNCPFGN